MQHDITVHTMRVQKIEGEHRDKCVSNNCRRRSVLQQKSDHLFLISHPENKYLT